LPATAFDPRGQPAYPLIEAARYSRVALPTLVVGLDSGERREDNDRDDELSPELVRQAVLYEKAA
jgi:hypothetical protein